MIDEQCSRGGCTHEQQALTADFGKGQVMLADPAQVQESSSAPKFNAGMSEILERAFLPSVKCRNGNTQDTKDVEMSLTSSDTFERARLTMALAPHLAQVEEPEAPCSGIRGVVFFSFNPG